MVLPVPKPLDKADSKDDDDIYTEKQQYKETRQQHRADNTLVMMGNM